MQAGMINEGLDNTDLFPIIGSYNIYTAYMGVFGWNGKTKYYCVAILYLNAVILYFMCLLSILYSVNRQSSGRRVLHHPDQKIKIL